MSSRRERLLAKIRELGTGPKRSLGQNFLVSDHVIERILHYAASTNEAGAKPASLVEVGPGLGALTEGLIEQSRNSGVSFQVIELDRTFAEHWRAAGVNVIEADALQYDWAKLELPAGSRLISNLPYQISSSLVVERSVAPFGLTSMVLMFQKEVAKRIAAKPKTEDFGLLSVIAQIGWVVDTVCDAGPQDFFPPPRVASRVLRFRRRADAPAAEEFQEFLRFTKAGYAHRRKLLAGNLAGWSHKGGASLERARLEELIEQMGFTKTARAEEFSPEQFLELFRRLR
ncbi:MAG: 16S rRNA (adenine(1518)-N(6)/adenine(1519)-N(6))-dimethyltransferase RsmA [Bdellovibrionales bacterium]|jgi:16S rRNA (adenine1518-N6/adenine1519-N6)-dimethyltransferase|nr:16S rRNA (adenine(1518)-N(6)/adenine(1519)-N(6))-dimethyltransferase RsmA [Bdellovibrionales bacterium]